MAQLFHRLATGYRAGLDLRRLYQKETERGSPLYRMKSKKIFHDIGGGASLAEAMSGTDGFFPQLPIAVIEAGEKGGRLEEAFRKLSEHYQSLVQFRTRFLQSIAWPCFELCAAVVILGLLILIMGWVMESNRGTPIDWFGLGLSVEGNFILYCTLVGLFFGSLLFLVVGSIKGWFGLWPMRIARWLPLIGKTVEALALSRFAWTMSVAENAGMSAVETAGLALRSTENFYYVILEDEVCDDLQSGTSFYKALKSTDCFPEDLLIYVDNGESAGELAESMSRASDEFQERAENNMKTIGTVGFVLTLIFVGLLMGSAIIYLYYTIVLEPLNEFL